MFLPPTMNCWHEVLVFSKYVVWDDYTYNTFSIFCYYPEIRWGEGAQASRELKLGGRPKLSTLKRLGWLTTTTHTALIWQLQVQWSCMWSTHLADAQSL